MKKITKVFLILTTVVLLALAFPGKVSAAPVQDGRTVFGENYTLESGRILNGDLNVIGGVVDIEQAATVNGNVVVLGGIVTIDGTVRGNLTVIGGTVSLEKNALVEGDLISPASHISQHPEAIIRGDQISNWRIPWRNVQTPMIHQPGIIQTPRLGYISLITIIGRFIARTLLITALGALLLLVMPKSVKRMNQALLTKPWQILGFGALTATAALIIIIILTITICLIPIAVLLGLALGLAGLIGWLSLGYELGENMLSRVFKAHWHPVLTAAMGNLVLYLIAKGLGLIPCLGGFLVFIVILFALGMSVVTIFGSKAYPRLSEEENGQIVLINNDVNKEQESQ